MAKGKRKSSGTRARRGEGKAAKRRARYAAASTKTSFGGKKFGCVGKKVAHRGGGTHPMVYCGSYKAGDA